MNKWNLLTFLIEYNPYLFITASLWFLELIDPCRDLLANNTEWDSELEWETDSQVVVPFALIGAFSIMVALSMAVSYLRDKRDVRPEKKGENTGFQFRDWLLTALVATYHFLIVLSETSFNRFLVIYAVQVSRSVNVIICFQGKVLQL